MLSHFGHSSGGSYKVAGQAPGRVASRSFRRVKNEGSCKVVHVAARSRQIHREQCRIMFAMSSYKASTSSDSLTSLVLARETMAMHSCGFCGTISRNNILLTVEMHSKWPEVSVISSTTVSKTMDVLRQMFATYGLPDLIVSDNGPQFISADLATFTKMNRIKHIRSAPYHTASNCLAERFVQSLKQAIKANQNDGRPLLQRLQNFLLKYQTTPHATTGVTPSSPFLHRHIRTRLHLLKQSYESHVFTNQGQQKTAHDQHAKSRDWFVGQSVMARNFCPGPDWVSGIIIEKLEPSSYLTLWIPLYSKFGGDTWIN